VGGRAGGRLEGAQAALPTVGWLVRSQGITKFGQIKYIQSSYQEFIRISLSVSTTSLFSVLQDIPDS
jgi:hypothetical protein